MIFWCKNVTNRHDPFGAERKFFGAEQYFHQKYGHLSNHGSLHRLAPLELPHLTTARPLVKAKILFCTKKFSFCTKRVLTVCHVFAPKYHIKLILICTKCFFRTITILHQNYTPKHQKVTNLHQIQATLSSQLF